MKTRRVITRMSDTVPVNKYGILQSDVSTNQIDLVVEQVKRVGYAVLDSNISQTELNVLSKKFDEVRNQYVKTWTENKLRTLNEYHMVRALLTLDKVFLKVAMNKELQNVLKQLITGKFILNQQNGVVNPPSENYSQGSWHRDLPYQHFTSDRPLAVNALFCLDNFTLQNGSTFVLPASHKEAKFPSDDYIRQNSVQVEAKAGQFIVLDCMIFHSGGSNGTLSERRGINHVFTIPYFKQQINLIKNFDKESLTEEEKSILGFEFQEPETIQSYLESRKK